MRRRDTLPFMLALCAVPIAAQSQQAGKVYRIGLLTTVPVTTDSPGTRILIDGLRDLGWIEGRHYSLDFVSGPNERLPGLATELVQRKVDLIIAAGTPHAQAAKGATSEIPIVFFYVGDPVGAGLVASLARPGGNITGLGGLHVGLPAKQLGLLKEMVPKASRIALFVNSSLLGTNPTFRDELRADMDSAAHRLGVTLVRIEVQSLEELDTAFATIARDRIDALLVYAQPIMFFQRARIAKLTLEQRLPTIVIDELAVNAGVLMSYGHSQADDLGRVPSFIDRILKGAKPGELPVEQPTRFYLTINQRTAKAIGITIPSSLLQRADKVIQ